MRFVRRRRRRTSPQDQAILEEEYKKCDRPDKAQRIEIAKRVELGEKEVQVRNHFSIAGNFHFPCARVCVMRARGRLGTFLM